MDRAHQVIAANYLLSVLVLSNAVASDVYKLGGGKYLLSIDGKEGESEMLVQGRWHDAAEELCKGKKYSYKLEKVSWKERVAVDLDEGSTKVQNISVLEGRLNCNPV